MNRRRTYVWTLIVFFLMWGVFGFVAAGFRGDKTAPPAMNNFSTRSEEAPNAVLPVTGEGQPEPKITIAHVSFGFIVLLGILALLNSANKPVSTYVRPKSPPDKR